jgi:hypothetical protein
MCGSRKHSIHYSFAAREPTALDVDKAFEQCSALESEICAGEEDGDFVVNAGI